MNKFEEITSPSKFSAEEFENIRKKYNILETGSSIPGRVNIFGTFFQMLGVQCEDFKSNGKLVDFTVPSENYEERLTNAIILYRNILTVDSVSFGMCDNIVFCILFYWNGKQRIISQSSLIDVMVLFAMYNCKHSENDFVMRAENKDEARSFYRIFMKDIDKLCCKDKVVKEQKDKVEEKVMEDAKVENEKITSGCECDRCKYTHVCKYKEEYEKLCADIVVSGKVNSDVFNVVIMCKYHTTR